MSSSTTVQDRPRGALLGLAWGDALGCPIEGWRAGPITRHYGRYRSLPDTYPASVRALPARRLRRLRPLGLHSDDTQQALALLAVAACPDGWSAERWADWLVAGAHAGAWRGTGRNFAAAVSRLERGVPPQRSGAPSAGIGAVMRVGPLGAALADDPDGLARVVVEASLTTHADLRAAAVAYAVAEAVRLPFAGQSAAAVLAGLAERVARVEAAWRDDPGRWTVHAEDAHAASSALQALAADPPADLAALGARLSEFARPHLAAVHGRAHPNQGFALLAGLHGLAAGLLAGTDPGARLAEVVAQGYDTDTVGAICGSVLGVRHGSGWIPTERLVDADRLGRWADALAEGRLPRETREAFLRREADLTRQERAFQQALTEPAARHAAGHSHT